MSLRLAKLTNRPPGFRPPFFPPAGLSPLPGSASPATPLPPSFIPQSGSTPQPPSASSASVTPPERALMTGGCDHPERNRRILYRWKGSFRVGPAHRRIPTKSSFHLYQSPTPIKSESSLKSKLTKDREHRANPATISQGAIRDCRRVDQRGYEVDDNNAFLPSSLSLARCCIRDTRTVLYILQEIFCGFALFRI